MLLPDLGGADKVELRAAASLCKACILLASEPIIMIRGGAGKSILGGPQQQKGRPIRRGAASAPVARKSRGVIARG